MTESTEAETEPPLLFEKANGVAKFTLNLSVLIIRPEGFGSVLAGELRGFSPRHPPGESPVSKDFAIFSRWIREATVETSSSRTGCAACVREVLAKPRLGTPFDWKFRE